MTGRVSYQRQLTRLLVRRASIVRREQAELWFQVLAKQIVEIHRGEARCDTRSGGRRSTQQLVGLVQSEKSLSGMLSKLEHVCCPRLTADSGHVEYISIFKLTSLVQAVIHEQKVKIKSHTFRHQLFIL